MKTFGPEARLINRSEEKLPEAQEALYESLVPRNKARAIDIEKFSDLYGDEAIRRDKEFVARREEAWRGEGNAESRLKYGELFEAIVNSQIEDSDLMGPNASVIVPSRYDDIANGIDSIVEFDNEGAASHIALAVDVTKGREQLLKKFADIRASIEEEKMSKVKYFKSSNFRGELRKVPRVVIGADQPTVEHISELMLRFMRMKHTITEGRKSKEVSAVTENITKEFSKLRHELATHPFQRLMLTEIRVQLEAFSAYASTLGKLGIADEYAKILHVIEDILSEKDREVASEAKAKAEPEEEDEIFRMIIEQAQSFNAGKK